MTAARTRRKGPWDYGKAYWSECAAVESGSHRCACSADCRSKQNWVGDGVDVPWKHVPPRRHGTTANTLETSQEWRNDPKLKPPKQTAASTKRITPTHLFTVTHQQLPRDPMETGPFSAVQAPCQSRLLVTCIGNCQPRYPVTSGHTPMHRHVPGRLHDYRSRKTQFKKFGPETKKVLAR
jgi:hypothetical protein